MLCRSRGDRIRRAEATARFDALFAEHARALLGYAARRVARPEDAGDVLAETMLVAWRRLDDIPSDPDARPWLFGVARNVLSNHHRSLRRGERLGERLKASLAELPVRDPADAIGERALVRDALAALDPDDRELLRLTAWEGLDPSEIAVVLGVPAATVRSRLHRARARLRSELERAGGGEREPLAGHEDSEGRISDDVKGPA